MRYLGGMTALPVRLEREFLNQHQADWAEQWFADNVPWQQDVYNFSGRKVQAPRLTALYGAAYGYSGITKDPLPFDNALTRLLDLINRTCSATFNSVLLNYYRSGNDSIGMHCDDEPELGESPVVASLSLGQSRDFTFQAKANFHEQRVLTLNHGDLLLMDSGCQEVWNHGILKDKCLPQACRRISLTFRTIV